MPEVADFPKALRTCLETVRFYFLQPSMWLCDFCARLILRIDAEIISRTKADWLNAKLAKIFGKQTNQIESKCFLISPNISKKLITLSNAQRTPHRGAARRSKFYLKEMAPKVQPLSAHPSSCPAEGVEATRGNSLAVSIGSMPACSCFSPESRVLYLKFNLLHFSLVPNRVVMRK